MARQHWLQIPAKPWGSSLPSLCLSFLVCELEAVLIKGPTLQGDYENVGQVQGAL